MTKEAIAGGAIGAAGQAMLTVDFGRTRLAGILTAGGEARASAAGRDGDAPVRRDGEAAATRP